MKQVNASLRRHAVAAAILLFVFLSGTMAEEAPKVIGMEVPCLTVSDGQVMGKLSYLPLTMTRRQDNAPLRVMLVDDTPNGSGRSIHSSIWQAAMTAAMLRGDTMHGITVSVEFSGYVDGPSAGGVTCLAILSALDGRQFPKDFAMTGTILPDGTVGSVGGIPAKMRAAAAAGIRHLFVPSFVRIVSEEVVDEEGARTEKEVDIQHLADELGVELIYVDNILDAYASLHGNAREARGYVNLRQRLRLPKAIEQIFSKHYATYRGMVQEAVKAHPDFRSWSDSDDYSFSPMWAERLYQEGRLSAATLQMVRCWLSWKAREQSDKLYEAFKPKKPDWSRIEFLREYHLRRQIADFRAEIDSEWERLSKEDEAVESEEEPVGVCPENSELTEICAQLELIGTAAYVQGKLSYFFGRRLGPEAMSRAPLQVLEDAWGGETDILHYMYLYCQDVDEVEAFLGELCGAMPKLKALPSAAEVERLFYSVGATAREVANENIDEFNKYASAAALTNDAAPGNRESVIDSIYGEVTDIAEGLHGLLRSGEAEKLTAPAYHLQCSLKAQVARVAWASAMVVIYGADDSNDFLPHLLRNARESAIHNLVECIEAGVPCISPVYDFEYAEALSGTERKLETLVAYWRSSLYAKALQMSFSGAGK